jgi:hypothetical protein
MNVPRFVDADGRSVPEMDIYRADLDGGSVAHGYLADAYRQVEADGWRKADVGDGRWDWRRTAMAPVT